MRYLASTQVSSLLTLREFLLFFAWSYCSEAALFGFSKILQESFHLLVTVVMLLSDSCCISI